MRFPNTRYGNPEEMKYYTQGIPIKDICKRLKRSEKSVKAWLNGDRKMPWWVPELLRLQRMEHVNRLREMGMGDYRRQLGLFSADVIEFAPRKAVLHGAGMSGVAPGELHAVERKRYA